MGAIKIDKLGAEDLPGPAAGGDPAVQVVPPPVTGLRPELPAGLGVELNRDPTSTCGCALHFVARWGAL